MRSSNCDNSIPLPASAVRRLLPDAALVLLQLAFLASTRLDQPTVLLDDAYIHFKYALSWVQGQGWVFNEGERVLGTTSPVWTFILGVMAWLTGGEIPRVATVTNFVFDAASMLLIVHLLRRASVSLLMRHAIALAVSAETLTILNSVGGMEMSLFLMTILIALEGIRSKRWWLLASPLAIAGFVRPEGAVLWIACALALMLSRQWTFAIKSFGAAIVGALLVALLIYLAYDAIIPHSLHAKRIAPWYLKDSGICHTQFFAVLGNLFPFNAISGFQAVWGNPADTLNSSIVAICQIALMIMGVIWMLRHNGRDSGFAAALFVLGYYLFYAITNPGIYPWYYVPYYGIAMLIGGVGTWQAIVWMDSRFLKNISVTHIRNSIINVVAISWLALALLNSANRGSAGIFSGDSKTEALNFRLSASLIGDREVSYIHVAEMMNEWIKHDPNVSVGCMEIGIFGFYYKGRVLDAYGLISPEALALADPKSHVNIPKSCRNHPANVYMMYKPDFIMAANIMFPNLPSDFIADYIQIYVPQNGIRVFVRRERKDEPWGFSQGDLRESTTTLVQ